MASRRLQKITLIDVKTPPGQNVEDWIVWLCKCLDIDPKKNKLAFDIFLHLLDASRKNKGVRTIDITRERNVTQAAVVYHMNLFMHSGLIVKRGREYFMRGGSLKKAINEMEIDMLRRMRILREMAEKIDEVLMIK